MGSPAMNFFPAMIIKENNNLLVKTKSNELPIPLIQQSRYEKYLGKEIILGIRPENIHSEEFIPPKTKPFSIKTIFSGINL